MITHKCDHCDRIFVQKKGERAATPTGWTPIRTYQYGGQPEFELCPECCKKLSLPEPGNEQKNEISNRLLEILEEIARIQVEECENHER